MGPAVGVHALGEFRQTIGTGLAGEQHRILKEWCVGCGGGELRAERAVRAECGAAGNQRCAGDFPERTGTTIAQGDFIAFRQVEEFGESFANRADQLLDWSLAMRSTEQRGGAGAERGDLLRANLAGARAETAVTGFKRCGNVHCHDSKGSQSGGAVS